MMKKFMKSITKYGIYLVAKLKIFNKINRTTFNNNNYIPMEKNSLHLHSSNRY